MVQRIRRRRVRGQSLVEFALTLGVLLLLIFGSIDVMQILMTRYTVAQAVRVAVHQAALDGGDNGAAMTLARTVLDSGMGTRAEKATITFTCAAVPCRRYSAITARITYADDVWVPIGPFTQVRADISVTRATEKDAN